MAEAHASRDDDALKKNTDCVYFLASPLTCKKGNDCEFRHSESARVNPRDCWYWLGGKCLMPDCPFRHPPLEGRTAVGATVGPPVPGATGVNKARTPCYFFSQGYCAKGEKCPFLHGRATPTSSSPQVPAPVQKPVRANALEVTGKKTGNAIGSATVVEKPIAAEGPAIPTCHPREASLEEISKLSPKKDGETPGSDLQNGAGLGRADVQLATSNAVLGSTNRLHVRQPGGDEWPQNGMESDEWWEESSPGFDVLVDAGPERSRYNPDLQDSYEGLEPGRAGPAAQRRGKSLHGLDEIDQYDYEYPSVFEQAAYDPAGPYNHGEFEPYEQQGYEHDMAYEQQSHPRSGVYGGRGIEEMYGRERERIMSNREGENGVGTNHRELKRRRVDGPPHHILQNRLRQRTESGRGVLDELLSQRWMEQNPQKLRELNLRQQLFFQQQGIDKFSSNTSWQKSGRSAGESARIARCAPPQNMNGEVIVKRLPNGRENEEAQKGSAPVSDIKLARLRREAGQSALKRENGRPKAASKVEAETLHAGGNLTKEHGSEGRKEPPSTFAGPKTLAQIRAEKRKGGAVDEKSEVTEMPGGLGKGVQSIESETQNVISNVALPQQDMPGDFNSLAVQSGAHEGKLGAQTTKNQDQLPATSMSRHHTGGIASEEKKIHLVKSVPAHLQVPKFVGPKSLSAILQAKRKAVSETARSPDDGIWGQNQRQSGVEGATSPVSSSIKPTVVDCHIPGKSAEVEDSGHPDVGEQSLSYMKERRLQAVSLVMQDEEMVHSAEALRNDDVVEELDSVRALGNLFSNAGTDGYEADTRDKAVVFADDDDEDFGLDDEDDEFAKKLGGFFS
ncbi:unnamed protein product [Sphagnum tenellum]